MKYKDFWESVTTQRPIKGKTLLILNSLGIVVPYKVLDENGFFNKDSCSLLLSNGRKSRRESFRYRDVIGVLYPSEDDEIFSDADERDAYKVGGLHHLECFSDNLIGDDEDDDKENIVWVRNVLFAPYFYEGQKREEFYEKGYIRLSAVENSKPFLAFRKKGRNGLSVVKLEENVL